MIKKIIVLLSVALAASLMINWGIGVLAMSLFPSSKATIAFSGFSRFLIKNAIIPHDTVFLNCATTFCKAACEGDNSTLQSLFSSNAISEIGEDELKQMLIQLNTYLEGSFVKLEPSRGPNTHGSIDGSTRSLMMEGPIDVVTTEGEYRLILKYVPFDDYDKSNEGILSIFIVRKEDDSNIKYPQYIDKENTNGLYIGS